MDKENARTQPQLVTPQPSKATRRAVPTTAHKTHLTNDITETESDKDDDEEPQQAQEAPSVWRDALAMPSDASKASQGSDGADPLESFTSLVQRAKETQRKGDLEAAVALWRRARDLAMHDESKDVADSNAAKCARRLAKVERIEVPLHNLSVR